MKKFKRYAMLSAQIIISCVAVMIAAWTTQGSDFYGLETDFLFADAAWFLAAVSFAAEISFGFLKKRCHLRTVFEVLANALPILLAVDVTAEVIAPICINDQALPLLVAIALAQVLIGGFLLFVRTKVAAKSFTWLCVLHLLPIVATFVILLIVAWVLIVVVAFILSFFPSGYVPVYIVNK